MCLFLDISANFRCEFVCIIELNSYKFNLSLNYDCTVKHSRITAFYVSLVTKGRLESPSVFFGKHLDINLDKRV